MRAKDLQNYIANFHKWIDLHGGPLLQAEQASLVANWREELAAAERLLEEKPELPIAFLGPSQQGKSSLINALVGENVLPVGASVGACTCVITSVHHHLTKNYRAEIDFISLEDWKAELIAIHEAAESPPSDEDTDLDREEREATQESALEKFSAVYRRDLPTNLTAILNDGGLALPDEIARHMSTGQPLVIDEERALTLRNKVRRYLVGREQHDDGQFWPLISRVRIYGNFEVLSNGVVLVDLPGLNDPNPAREQVTKKYLEEARHIWLVCNSQTGIDRVFTQVLRENSLLLRLFLEGRLNTFSVIATRADDINVQAVLDQMGVDLDDFDGNHAAVLEFRRKEIKSHIQQHLLAIAEDIAAKADTGQQRDTFLRRVGSIPVFSISTSAYLFATDRMPLYQGMKLSPEESHIPKLIEHLHSITLEESYKAQVEASFQRLRMLHDQASRFFLDRIRRIGLDNDQARKEWDALTQVANQAIQEGQQALKTIQIRFEESLQQRCLSFEQQLIDLDARATNALHAVFISWQTVNWRSLRAAVERRGIWFSRHLQREFNFNRDIARAYLDLLPFVWEEFFGSHLSGLIDQVAGGTQAELHKSAARLKGAMDMIHHQPADIRDSIEISLRTAGESFQLQSGQVRADLMAQIQRTRQTLSNGMVETASSFMQAAYARAGKEPDGSGVKRKLLDILIQHAKQHAPNLFINMRQELTEGVDVLQGSMKPQLSKIVGYGGTILGLFRQNMANHQIVTPEQREHFQTVLKHLPQLANL
jgi:hypothetical protein